MSPLQKMSVNLWSQMEDLEKNNLWLILLRTSMKSLSLEYLPNIPNITVLPVEYCSVSSTLFEVSVF